MFFDNIEQYSLMGVQLINLHNIGYFLVKLAIDLIFAFIILRLIFYPVYKERDYLFTTFMINVSVFLVCFMLGSIKLKIGFAFGLFAVFSIIRYRTEQIPIRQMTYMFTAIIIAVLNALADEGISYSELLLANMVVLATILILEKNLLHSRDLVKVIKYEKIDLVKPENYDLLIKDLTERTGFKIQKAEVESVNFLNDTSMIKIYYRYPDN
ncbi:MAG: DUF4956 domain-containing protein [Deltaproteobacteria bacterium]|nr:DUF4956 domain-containing protein [Deltaproteobacteria bacterium]